MTQTLSTFQFTHAFSAADEQFMRAQRSLDRIAQAQGGKQSEKRRTERLEFSGNPVLQMELTASSVGQTGAAVHVALQVWGRDLSRGGMSFLLAREAVGLSIADRPATLDVVVALRESNSVQLGFTRPDGSLIWLESRVLRVRPAPMGLHECGVHFEQRVQAAM